MGTKPRGSRIPPTVIAEVMERANGACELPDCLAYSAEPIGRVMEFHHRQARAMGGSKGRDLDTAANIIAVHKVCHQRIHAAPVWARKHGYIISQFATTPA